MARLRIPLQARRRRPCPALEHSAPAAPGLADVVRGTRQPAAPAVVLGFRPAAPGERAGGDGAPGEESVPGRSAHLPAGAVLRLHLCRQRGKSEGYLVGPALARSLLSRGAAEEEVIRTLVLQITTRRVPHACASPITRMRPWARLRGFVLTVMSTSWPSVVKRRIRRSLEKFASRPLRRADTFG